MEFDCNYGIAEEALHLLESYTDGPYPILKQNADSVPEELKPTVLYLVNTNNR